MFEMPTQEQIDEIMRKAHVERARVMRDCIPLDRPANRRPVPPDLRSSYRTSSQLTCLGGPA